jgi:4-hydroxy-tetrahydrodipicolinate synthase
MSLGRLMTAMITPFNPDDTLNLPEAGRIARWLVDEGNDALVVAGTTGEAPTLSVEERLALFAAVKEAVGTRARIVAGTGGNDTRSSVSLTKQAAQLGVDGILAVVPYYNKPTQEGMLRHFGAIAEATTLPIIVYNIPSRTGTNMLPVTLLELARRYQNIVGVKESSGDFAQFTEILRNRRPGFQFWSGDDPLFVPSLAIGGDGLISVAAHLCARELKAILTAYDEGRAADAGELHRILSPLFAALFVTTNPIAVKWAMGQLGFNVGDVRSPLSALPDSLIPNLKRAIEPYIARAAAIVTH